MFTEKDLTQEQLDDIEEEVKRRSSMTIRSDEAIRFDLIKQKVADMNRDQS